MYGYNTHRNTAAQNSPRPRARKAATLSPVDAAFARQMEDAADSPRLRQRGKEALNSISFGLRRYGSISQAQRDYATALLAQADGTAEPAPARPMVEIGNMAGVLALFDKAKVKSPMVRLQLEDGTPIVLNKAGPRASAPGTINITDGGPFGANRWFGRIDKAGTWEQARAAAGIERNIRELLAEFAEAPAVTAAKYAKLTGGCSFCRTPVSDPRSIAVGYGETCAKNWGLPWGKK